MTEIEFIKHIVFRKYPKQLTFLVFSELIGAALVVMGIGAIIPLLGSLSESQAQIDGNIGKLIDFLGLVNASTVDVMIFLILILLGRTVIDIIRTYIAGVITINIGVELRRDINQQILNYDWPYLQKSDRGLYVQTITAETEIAKGAINDLASVIAYVLLSLSMCLSLVFFSPNALFILMPMAIGLHFLSAPLIRKTRALGKARLNQMGIFNNAIIDNNFLMKLIKSEGHEAERTSRINTIITALKAVEVKTFHYQMVVNNIGSIFAVVIVAALSYYYLVLNFSDGTALIFNLMLVQRCATYLNGLQSLRRRMNTKIPSYAKCSELLQDRPHTKQTETQNSNPPTQIGTPDIDMKLDNVSFSYTPDIRALNNVSMSLPQKGIVGIIGHSGSGKTTLADIILRLFIPQSGTLSVNDKPIETIDPAQWQKLVAYVPQDAYLFGGTLRENLTLGITDTDDSDIWEALKKAHCYDFVQNLPARLDTAVQSSGNNFSGGERQRLSIARAILRKSRLLVMDEPSSALDFTSEQEIMKTLHHLKNDMLIIMITHSLNFLNDMDRIFILQSGKCIWSGDYDTARKENIILNFFTGNYCL